MQTYIAGKSMFSVEEADPDYRSLDADVISDDGEF